MAKLWDNEQELLQTFKRHAPPNAEALPILAAAWSPDEQFIATVHETGTVRLTRVATGEVIHELNKEDDPARALAVSPDGATLALGCDSGAVLLWNPKTNAAEIQTFGRHSATVRGVAFSANGKLLASCSDDATICVLNRESGECTARLEAERDAPTVIAFAPDNQLLVSGHTSGHLRFWNLADQSERNQSVVYAKAIVTIAFSPDGSTVAAADGQSVRVWDVKPPALGKELVPRLSLSAFKSPVTSPGFAPRSRGLLTGETGGELLIWDPSSGVRVARYRRHTGPVTSIAVAPRSETVLTAGPAAPGLLWTPLPDEDRIRPLAAISAHEKGARLARISPDRLTLIIDGFDNRTSIWDLNTGELQRRLGDPDAISSCQLSSNGKLLAVSYRNGRLEVQNVKTAEVVHQLPELEHSADVLAFSPDGSHLAAMCRDHGLSVYGLATPGAEPTVSLAPPRLPLTHVAFAPDSQSFLTCIGDFQRRQTPGETTLWNRGTGMQISAFGGHASEVRYAAFDPEGTSLITGGADRTANIWEVTTERRQSRLPHHSAIFAAVFDPRSDLLFTSTYDGGLSLWDWKKQARLMRLPAHSDLIGHLDLASDLSVLATASRDGYVKLWALAGEGNELRIVNANAP